MNKEARKALDEAYEKLVEISLNQLPLDGEENLVHPDIMGWSTTLAEGIHTIDESVALIKQQEKSATEYGLKFFFERNNIHEHGTGADSIVKTMLEHSRDGAGVMEPTSLNGLIKEFLNLSFHGMRAGKNSINVDISSDLDKTIGDIPLIAEDYSRVIVNLFNNAFDAMREKQQSDEAYKAKLTVRTIREVYSEFFFQNHLNSL